MYLQDAFLDQAGVRTFWAKIKVELAKKVNTTVLENYMTDEEIEAAITAALTGYATTSFVTQAIASAIASVETLRIEIVSELPETGESNIIYFVAMADPKESNSYEEYIWVNGEYELIGTTQIDLSGYWSKIELTAMTADELEEILV